MNNQDYFPEGVTLPQKRINIDNPLSDYIPEATEQKEIRIESLAKARRIKKEAEEARRVEGLIEAPKPKTKK